MIVDLKIEPLRLPPKWFHSLETYRSHGPAIPLTPQSSVGLMKDQLLPNDPLAFGATVPLRSNGVISPVWQGQWQKHLCLLPWASKRTGDIYANPYQVDSSSLSQLTHLPTSFSRPFITSEMTDRKEKSSKWMLLVIYSLPAKILMTTWTSKELSFTPSLMSPWYPYGGWGIYFSKLIVQFYAMPFSKAWLYQPAKASSEFWQLDQIRYRSPDILKRRKINVNKCNF